MCMSICVRSFMYWIRSVYMRTDELILFYQSIRCSWIVCMNEIHNQFQKKKTEDVCILLVFKKMNNVYEFLRKYFFFCNRNQFTFKMCPFSYGVGG